MIDKTIKKVLVIGSGPIIIGQAAEFAADPSWGPSPSRARSQAVK